MSRFSRFIWMMSLLCVDSAISQVVTVTGFIRDGVLMPCVSSADDFRPEEVSAYWRDRDDKVVLDIVEGVQNPNSQDPKFRGRVLSPRDQNRKGNFSIVLQNLREDDAGEYECHIPTEDVQRSFLLRVAAKPVPASRAPPPPSPPPPSSSSSSPPAGNAALSLPLPLLLLWSSWQQQ